MLAPTLAPPPQPPPQPPPPAASRTHRRWLARVAVGLALGGALALDSEPLGALVFVFVIVVPFEKLFPRHRQPVRRPAIGTDIAYALTSGPLATAGILLGLALGTLSLLWLPALALRPLVTALPEVPRLVLGLVLFDLLVYWAHRFGHEVPFLWRFHRIHHSTEHLDWVSGFRQHPFDGVFLAPAFLVLLVAGFSAEATGVLLVVQIAVGLFLHANVRWRWRPIQRLVATPEFHHWHHANEPGARNSNYAGLLPVWDLVFGTWFMPSNRRPQVYGIDGGVPSGILAQLWLPLRGLRNPLPLVRHPRRGLREVRLMVARGLRQCRASATRPPELRDPVPM